MLWLAILFVWLHELQSTSCTNCLNSYSCALTALNVTQALEPIFCAGYKSCISSPGIENNREGAISCLGSYSCANSTFIKTNGRIINCKALKSCCNVNIGGLYMDRNKTRDSYMYCTGTQSCVNTKTFINITHKFTMLCSGELSCVNSHFHIISGNPAHIYLNGYLSAYNTTFKISNNNTVVNLGGHNSGYQATIICDAGKTCSINCDSTGCNNLTWLCSDKTQENQGSCIFNIDCSESISTGLTGPCPDGNDGVSNVVGIVDSNVVKDIGVVYSNVNISEIAQSLQEYEIESDDIYVNGTRCDDYEECENEINNEYIELESNSGSAITATPINCRGMESCFFTNITFNLDLAVILNSDSDNYDISFITCDGLKSCSFVPSFIVLNISNSDPDYYNYSDSYLSDDDFSEINYTARFVLAGENPFDQSEQQAGVILGTRDFHFKNSTYYYYYDDYNLTQTNYKVAVNIDIYCTATDACHNQIITNVRKIYCTGGNSCRISRISNVKDSIWVYGLHGLYESEINYVGNNIYLLTNDACRNCNVSNIFGNIYGFGIGSINGATISNVSGAVFGFTKDSLGRATIQNVAKVYCAWESACRNSIIRGAALIMSTYPIALSGSIIVSDMESSTTTEDSRTMIVKLYYTSEDFSIYCSYGDTCKIGCFAQDACTDLELYCNGTCLVDCDDSVEYQCPTVKLGSYSVWYSNLNQSNMNIISNSSETDDTEESETTGVGSQPLYQAFLNGFTAIACVVAGVIIFGICAKQCVDHKHEIKACILEKKYFDRNFIDGYKFLYNKDFCIFLFVFLICIFLGIICILYGFGQISQLVLSDYWCDKKDLETIYQHSFEYNLNHGTNEGCWKSKEFTVDSGSLFQSSSIYSTTSDFTTLNIIRCVIWLVYGAWFLWMAVAFMSLQVINTICCNEIYKKKQDESGNCTVSPEEDQESNNKTKKTRSSFHSCCPCCCCLPRQNKTLEFIGNMYWKYIKWFKLYFGEDTPNWFILLSIREFFEIVLQVFAAYNYNGLNVFSPNQTILSFSEIQVKFFVILLSLNCIFTGILWLCYIFFHNLCHGRFFKDMIFFIDTIFDTFYALYPIVAISIQNGFNLELAVAVLQTTNVYVSTLFDLYNMFYLFGHVLCCVFFCFCFFLFDKMFT